MNVMHLRRVAVTALAAATLVVPIAAPAHAANGACKYGQKSDGSCWDNEATQTTNATGNSNGHKQVLNPNGTITNR